MKKIQFPLYFLMIICCQSNPSVAQKQERIKIFKTTTGEAIVDFSKKDSVIIGQKIGNNYDTIFCESAAAILDVPDVKIFDSKCIFLVNNGLIIYFIVYKKSEKKWELVGSRQLIYIDRPVSQEVKIVNEKNIQVFMQDKLVREYFIDYEKNEFKLVDYYKK